MIQELLGSSGVGGIVHEERKKISIGAGGGGFLFVNTIPTTSPSQPTTLLSSSPSPSSAPPPPPPAAAENNHLRCPRCDSSNTKFCYYNNYNLTQPRHFCKTCRRYWTRGGALRNVPIGGGCRKSKSSNCATSSAAKPKSAAARSDIGLVTDHDTPPTWAPAPPQQTSAHNSHILAILRANSALNSTNMEPLLWRNSQFPLHLQQQQQQQPQHDFMFGEASSTTTSSHANGIQDLYQRLRSPAAGGFYADQFGLSSRGLLSLSSSPSSVPDPPVVLEPTPVSVAGGELGVYWNQACTWSDLPAARTGTTNGAFP